MRKVILSPARAAGKTYRRLESIISFEMKKTKKVYIKYIDFDEVHIKRDNEKHFVLLFKKEKLRLTFDVDDISCITFNEDGKEIKTSDFLTYRDHRKNLWWSHYMESKQYWAKGFTEKRLEKAKILLWKDSVLWGDVLDRHGGINRDPGTYEGLLFSHYDLVMLNMTGIIMRSLIDHGIIKP
jgi:hypothetical protein